MLKQPNVWKRTAAVLSKTLAPSSIKRPTTIDVRIAKVMSGRTNTVEDTGNRVNTREAERFIPYFQQTYLTSTSGERFNARIINLSVLAVAIEADFSRIPAADVTQVGRRSVRMGRSLMVGHVFLFDRPLSERWCRHTGVL